MRRTTMPSCSKQRARMAIMSSVKKLEKGLGKGYSTFIINIEGVVMTLLALLPIPRNRIQLTNQTSLWPMRSISLKVNLP
jgi:hypothetical protein